ncbi:hypothetical protein ACLOJK_010101 [Asimina triloba]
MGDVQKRNLREENIRSQSTPNREMADGGNSGAVKKKPNPYPYPNPAESKIPYPPNPPEATLPDAATLRDQWRFAIRQYSKWYSHAWGTAILAGAAFFALGWIVKGSNPLPSFHQSHDTPPHTNDSNSPSPSDNPTHN